MYTLAQWENTRKEIRHLRIENSVLKRSRDAQKDKASRLEEELHRLEQENNRLKKEHEKLRSELEKAKRQRDTYVMSHINLSITRVSRDKLNDTALAFK